MADDPKISIITPTTRPTGLIMPSRCLSRQTIQDYEWLIAAPAETAEKIRPADTRTRVFADPPRREGDFYRLNGAWNDLIRQAKGELLIFMVDHIWFEPTAIEQFWAHYQDNPMRGVSSIGHHYDTIVYDRPEVLWAFDERPTRLDARGGDRWAINAMGMELAFACLPKEPLLAVGGFDEGYDKGFGMSEYEACLRMSKLGVTYILGRSQEHRNYKHEREWTPQEQAERYGAAVRLFVRHAEAIEAGTRSTIPWEPRP